MDFYEDSSFNSPDVEIGTIAVWESDVPTWDGHTATVVDVTRDEAADVTQIVLIEGSLQFPTQRVELNSQAELDSYVGDFRGWGEIGEGSAMPLPPNPPDIIGGSPDTPMAADKED